MDDHANRIAPQAGARSRLLPVAALVAVIFLAKFLAYGWLVTPLWDIPDESGHYSYVEDVARGEWPVLGQARMGEEVTRSWINPDAAPGMNWIAQHPPLFYALDAPVVIAAQAAGLDFEQRVHAARIPGAIFAALTILGLALFLARATGRDELGLAGAIFLAATPMFTHLATGVSHDTLVACTAAWAAYWCVRWLESDRYRHLLYAGALVALCTITKLTALAMAVPLFFALAWRLWRMGAAHGPIGSLYRVAALWLVMFVPICLWIVRNLLVLEQPFPGSSLIYDRTVVDIGFFELMLEFPFWQNTLLNFIALVGWNGSGDGVLETVRATGAMARYFLAFIGIAGLGVLLRPVVRRFAPGASTVAVGIALAAVAYASVQLPLPQLAAYTALLLLGAFTCTFVANAGAFARAGSASAGDPIADGRGWLLATVALCTLFFAFMYYQHLQSAFTGAMRATHGRYLYPVAPFMLLALLWPFRGLVARRMMLCGAVVAMVFADRFFLRQVLPLYGQL